jgi:tetratricopeptide (TPR) repeat protein
VVGVSVAPWSWGYWTYYNPYCPPPVVVNEVVVVDYSQPLVLAAPAANAQASTSTSDTTTHTQAMELLNGARAVFQQGDYVGALAQANQAIARKPSDPVLHEFRALTLFALGQYKDAAGALYAVLSVGPGWDWATMSGFYPREDVYVGQLRALEQYVHDNPTQPEAKFVLAYHYMTGGYNDAAAKQLQAVVQLNPKDQLSGQLIQSLTKTAAATPTPATTTTPTTTAPATITVTTPVTAATLAGQWKSTRPDGGTIALDLAADSTYSWQFTQNGKLQEFKGTYTVTNNLLILNQNGSAVMVGQVTWQADNRFNFKLPGSSAADPGLTFAR